jgi:hypothetical protein
MRSSKGAGTRNSSEWGRCRALLALVKGKVRPKPFGQGVAGEKVEPPLSRKKRAESKTLASGPKTAWAPARYGGNGALFRCSRNYCDAADDVSAEGALGLRGPPPRTLVNLFWNALPLWHVGRRRRFDPGRPGSFLVVRRSHGYPVFLPPLKGRRLLTSPSRLPVHDDAMTLCRRGRGCQITNRALSDHSIR